MVTDFDEKHDEYLISLQQRNRLQERLKRKDPVQTRLEQLEKGFSLYVNGANSELRKYRRKITPHLRNRSKATRTKEAAQLEESGLPEHSTQTAPSKIQRRNWLQETVAIKTEGGGKLYIKPSLVYSDDFEPYESLAVESSSDDDDGPLSQQELSSSLQRSMDEKRMEEDSLSDDYDSVEEDVFSEPSPTEEAITGFEGLQLDSSGALQKEGSEPQDSGRCSSLDSGASTVLNQDQSKVKPVQVLSAKRKDSAEVYIPVKPVMLENKGTQPLSAEFLHHDRHETICSSCDVSVSP